jgi:hypothetical protein
MTPEDKHTIISQIEKLENQNPGFFGHIILDIEYRDGVIYFVETDRIKEKIKVRGK